MLGIFILAVGGGYFYVTNILDKIENINLDESKLGINDELSKKYGKVQNIALFGVDATDGGHGRSDSTMILTIDREHEKLKITSLMRDSYVTIDGHGNDKLNHAYAFGGPELAIKTINQNFGLNIKDFATVNFSSLPKIIDTLGGINIDIDNEELKYINKYINELNRLNKTNAPNIKTQTGIQKLNGTQALAYCRIRYTSGGDYKRTERHREVLEKLFEEIKGVAIAKYPTILNDLMPMVKTSLSTNEILNLGTNMVNMGKSLEQDRFPKDSDAKSAMINGVYYLQFDKEATKDKLHKWIFEDIK